MHRHAPRSDAHARRAAHREDEIWMTCGARTILMVAAGSVILNGCSGPSSLTRRLDRGNRQALRSAIDPSRGAEEALLAYATTPEGARLLIEQFRHQPLGSLRLERRGTMTVGLDDGGQLLFTATTLPSGSVVVADIRSQQVAFYSEDQVARFLDTAPQRPAHDASVTTSEHE